MEKIKEKSLPSKGKLCSKLKKEGKSDRNYKHSKRVSDAFKIK